MSTERLLEALAAFCDADTKETRQRVLEELARSELIFPAAERGRRDQGVRLAFTKDQDGRQVTLTGQLPYQARIALAECLGTRVVLFPGDHGGFSIHPGEFAYMLHRRPLDQRVTDDRKPESETVGPEEWWDAGWPPCRLVWADARAYLPLVLPLLASTAACTWLATHRSALDLAVILVALGALA